MKYANNYQYVITDRLGVIDVAPLSEADFTIQWTRQDEGKRYYKKELPSKIFFLGNAFKRLLKIEQSIYRCSNIQIEVQRKCVTDGVLNMVTLISGTMQLNLGSWDIDRGQVEISLIESQEYSCIENNMGKDVDLLSQIGADSTVNLFPTTSTIEKKEVTQTYTTLRPGGCDEYAWDEAYTPESVGWQVYSNTVFNDYTPGSPKPPGSLYFCTVTTKYARQKMAKSCGDPSPGGDWILWVDTCGGLTPPFQRLYVKPVSLYGCEITYANPDNPAYSFNNTYECKIVGDTSGGEPVVIDNGVTLKRALEVMVSDACTGMAVKSDFFQINPDTVTDINYITGAISTITDLLLFQKSDVKRPGVSANATRAVTTLEKLLNALTLMFNCAWRIVADPVTGSLTFRIEHVNYFTPGFGLDLTDERYKLFVKALRRYTYTNEKIVSQETFSFMEARNPDFVGRPIIYNSGCVTKNTSENVKTNNVEDITTDVEYCLANPDSESVAVSDDGLVMIAAATDANGVRYIISEAPIFAGATLNNPLSWAHLHRDYYMYDRPVKFGNLNGQDVEFITTKPTKRGDKISIPLCCGDVFNPDDMVITLLGNGVVDKAVYSFKSETLELDLLYNADENLVNNDPPTVTDKTFITYSDVPIDIDVLAGYSDPDTDATVMAVEIVLAPVHGTAVVLPNKKIRYTATPGYFGDDMFVFRVLDNWSEPSNNGLVAGTIYPPNTGPIAGNVNYSATKDTTLTDAAPGIFENSTDDHEFTLDTYDAISAQGGTVAVSADGSFTYDPPAGYAGADSFTFTIIDSEGLTATGTVHINVIDPTIPTGIDDNYQTRKNFSLSVPAPGLIGNDAPGTGGTLTAVAETKATTQGGSVTINTDGSFSYTPPSGYVGNDSFDYTLDNGIATDTAEAIIRVVPDVWVHLTQINENTTTQTTNCSGSDVNKGSFTKTATQRLRFYSNAGGTIPLDLTGVGMKFNIKRTHTAATGVGASIGAGTDSYFDKTVTGAVFDFVDVNGNANIVHKEIFNCSAQRTNYDDYVFVLAAGDYTII